MTEGPTQYGLEPRACPFVALAEDRDRRLDQPDPRHRCFAEPDPQPRAEAHQRAYCLSPAFAACPIFLDWAARAAADPVATRREAPSPAQLARPSDLTPPRPSDPAARAWAAPPPWSGDDPRPRPTPAGEQLAVFPDPAEGADPDRDLIGADLGPLTRPRFDAGAAQDAAHAPDAADGPPPQDAPRPSAPGSEAFEPPSVPPASPSSPAPPPFLASRERTSPPPRPTPSPDEPGLAAPIGSPGPVSAGLGASAAASFAASGPPPRMPQASPDAARRRGRGAQARPAPVKRIEPDWIKTGRQREAYPKLRTRIGMQHIPIALAALAGLGVTALSLFLLAGFLGQGTTTLPTERPPSPTPSASPTPSPSPTPLTYTVRSGDAMETIARRFGLTVDQIACANGITDPNVLQVGQVLVIPDDEFTCATDELPTESP